MPTERGTEDRLAELIWRTIKIRVSLLVLMNLFLLITWSTIVNGDKQAKDLDVKFCRQLVAETEKEVPSVPLSADTWCTPEGARNYVEASRTASQMLLTASRAMEGANKDAVQKLLDRYLAKQKEFSDYDRERDGAYPLQLRLSSEYSGSDITLNGRFVAKLLPFCILVVLAIVVVLGFQQTSYRKHLFSLLSDGHGGDDRILGIARGQFFTLAEERGVSFLSWSILSPEKLAVGSLYLLLAVLFSAVLFDYVARIVNLTNSTLLSYPTAVLGAAFGLACLLIRTRNVYARQYSSAQRFSTGNEARERSKISRWLPPVMAAVGFLSLLLPWAVTGGSLAPLKGYNFVLPQRILWQVGQVTKYYPLDPGVFAEVRAQVALALLFVLVSGAAPLWFRANSILCKVLRKTRTFLAVLVLFLSVNYLMYMGILESGSLLDDNPFLSHLFNSEQGYPMSVYNPAYGFLIFLASCSILIWFSIRRSRD
ncbi:MAG: hypothetical protein ACLP3K_17650 [Candidatus Acidiferrales bacterium]